MEMLDKAFLNKDGTAGEKAYITIKERLLINTS
jgi:hypothetical protein